MVAFKATVARHVICKRGNVGTRQAVKKYTKNKSGPRAALAALILISNTLMLPAGTTRRRAFATSRYTRDNYILY